MKNNIEFRLAESDGFFDPQVRRKWLTFWLPWQSIGEHGNRSYGLYQINSECYFHSRISAIGIIDRYKSWIERDKSIKYHNI